MNEEFIKQNKELVATNQALMIELHSLRASYQKLAAALYNQLSDNKTTKGDNESERTIELWMKLNKLSTYVEELQTMYMNNLKDCQRMNYLEKEPWTRCERANRYWDSHGDIGWREAVDATMEGK